MLCGAASVAYPTEYERMNTLSLPMAAAISAGLVTTLPSCNVRDVTVPPAPGVIAVTWTLAGTACVTTTSLSVCPGAGVAVTVSVCTKFGPLTVSPSVMLTLCVSVTTVGCTTRSCNVASTSVGSVVGLSSSSLPNWRPPRAWIVRSGLPLEKAVSARSLRRAVTCTEMAG